MSAPWGSDVSPAAFYTVSRLDRKGPSAREHLRGNAGFMHADGLCRVRKSSNRFRQDHRSCPVWPIFKTQFSRHRQGDRFSLATEAVARALQNPYAVRGRARGQPPDTRCGTSAGKVPAGGSMTSSSLACSSELPKISRASRTFAKATRYALSAPAAARNLPVEWHLEIDNNAAERGHCGAWLSGRKNWLFRRAPRGGRDMTCSIAYTLIRDRQAQ